MNKKNKFLQIFNCLEKKYKTNNKRLAAQGWDKPWQVLIATIMSAQSKDELTIEIAKNLFKNYPSLKDLAHAKKDDVLKIFQSLNYNKTKARHSIMSAYFILNNFKGEVPKSINDLMTLPGVGRKTANLVLSEVHDLPAICVDTHVHRISNVLELVNTKNPDQTEIELKKFVPKKYWSKINRYFVLWGKEVSGYNKKKLLEHINCIC
jgi:endonuclease-3